MTEPQPPADPTPLQPNPDDELKAFLLVLRQGMLLINSYIEKKYNLGGKNDRVPRCNCGRKDLHAMSQDEAA